MTLVDLVKKLKAIQEAHPMLRTFGEGDIYDYVDNGGEIQYPVLWTVVRPSVYSGTTMRYDLVLLFADLLTEDKSNSRTNPCQIFWSIFCKEIKRYRILKDKIKIVVVQLSNYVLCSQ